MQYVELEFGVTMALGDCDLALSEALVLGWQVEQPTTRRERGQAGGLALGERVDGRGGAPARLLDLRLRTIPAPPAVGARVCAPVQRELLRGQLTILG